MVHYVSLDTETDLGHGLTGGVEDNKPGNSNGPFGLMNEQIQWLENDLKNVDRELTPWVVVGLQRVDYSCRSNLSLTSFAADLGTFLSGPRRPSIPLGRRLSSNYSTTTA